MHVSPVDDILSGKGARNVNVNLLRYFSEPLRLDADAKAFLKRGMRLAAAWASEGKVVPHVGRTVIGSADAISAGLAEMAAGKGAPGKTIVALRGGDWPSRENVP